MKRICVFCGSSPGNDPRYLEAARSMGRILAGRGLGLVDPPPGDDPAPPRQ